MSKFLAEASKCSWHTMCSTHVFSLIYLLYLNQVIYGYGKVNEASTTIFVTCEEDMEEAIIAAKRGMRTFSSEWFMKCVMKQELDMEACQFAESL